MAQFAKDPSNIYQKSYHDKLYNQISLKAGKYIPVYDNVPANAQAPYIILSTIDITPIGVKGEYLFNAEMTIDIVTRFPTNGGGKLIANTISNQIFSKVLTSGNFYADDHWNIFQGSLSRSTYLEHQNASTNVIRKLITFSNKIQQL